MNEKINTKFEIATINGGTDLSAVEASDHVSVTPEGSRGVLLPAGQVLTVEKTPLAEAKDGSVLRLDGTRAIKLGGEIIAVTKSLDT